MPRGGTSVAATLTVTNEANLFLTREYRYGWTLPAAPNQACPASCSGVRPSRAGLM